MGRGRGRRRRVGVREGGRYEEEEEEEEKERERGKQAGEGKAIMLERKEGDGWESRSGSSEKGVTYHCVLSCSQRKAQGVFEMVSSWMFGSKLDTYSPSMSYELIAAIAFMWPSHLIQPSLSSCI